MQFVAPISIVEQKLEHVHSFLFDWDGVFNDGTKGHEVTSHFTEADSMGINMLRFSHWLKHGKIPYCAIITGRQNKSAQHFSQREHFHAVYMGYTNKQEALDEGRIDPSGAVFFFDDILDLSIAAQCKLRIMISRDQSPLTTQTATDKGWCELITGATGGAHALREACELLIGINGNWDEVIDSRVAYNDSYRNYLEARNATSTKLHEKSR
jgi:3-deoxy-D-manno-octulosonate 8-phosphate phosphatase (KDO 8-P phosphatase)